MKRKIFYYIYLTSPFILINILYQANPSRYGKSQFLIPMILGALAYSWFIWQFILSARPKFIDELIGLDKVYRLHGIMAILSLGLAFSHNLLFERIWGESTLTMIGSISLNIFLALSVISIVLMTKARWMGVKLLKPIIRMFEVVKIFKYEHYKLMHNLTVVGLVFMQIHVLLTSSAKSSSLVFSTYMSYFTVAVAFYLYHKVFKPWILEEDNCEVVEIKAEANKMWSVVFKAIGHKFDYVPGQFAFFKIFVDGHKEEHPFSISSAPNDGILLSVTVKELGDFTGKMKKLRVGDRLVLDGPYGEFSYVKHPKERQTVFIAGGVGITPVMSMLRHMHKEEPNRKVLLLWGMRSLADYAFREEINLIKENMPNLQVVPVVSADDSFEGEKGFIDYKKLLKYLTGFINSSDKTGFYICGPQILMKNSLKNLSKLDINPKLVHYESFSL